MIDPMIQKRVYFNIREHIFKQNRESINSLAMMPSDCYDCFPGKEQTLASYDCRDCDTQCRDCINDCGECTAECNTDFFDTKNMSLFNHHSLFPQEDYLPLSVETADDKLRSILERKDIYAIMSYSVLMEKFGYYQNSLVCIDYLRQQPDCIESEMLIIKQADLYYKLGHPKHAIDILDELMNNNSCNMIALTIRKKYSLNSRHVIM